jgi:hypothetical protein
MLPLGPCFSLPGAAMPHEKQSAPPVPRAALSLVMELEFAGRARRRRRARATTPPCLRRSSPLAATSCSASNLLRKAEAGDLDLMPWQFGQVRVAIERLEEERFAEGERTMSEAELPDLYEPAVYVANEPIDRRHLLNQLAAVVAAA